MESEQRPQIFRYLDYRQFLSAFFIHMGRIDSKYSRRWFARKAGMKSPQLISMILKGERKLSVENAQLLALALRLEQKEEEYLMILIELENAAHKEKQLEILDRIRFQFNNGLFSDLPDTGLEYIRKWYYPAVRELCVLKDLAISKETLARALAISKLEAQEALDLLLQMGFLKFDGESYIRREPSVRASDFVSPLVMMQYHLQILERAYQAVQLKREFRHFDSLVVALSTRDVEMVRDRIRQFIREIDMHGEASTNRNDVFQLSIQFFSLTGGRAKEISK